MNIAIIINCLIFYTFVFLKLSFYRDRHPKNTR